MSLYVIRFMSERTLLPRASLAATRISIWLFKPSMRLSYAVPTQYVLAKSASIRASKVLYKILDTAAAYSDLDK